MSTDLWTVHPSRIFFLVFMFKTYVCTQFRKNWDRSNKAFQVCDDERTFWMAAEDLLFTDSFLFLFFTLLSAGAAHIQNNVLPRIHTNKIVTFKSQMTS